jgi:transposase
MARAKLHLGIPEIAASIDLRHAKERNAWRKNRLLAVKLAARGEHTAAQVAEFCGIARGYLFEWIKTVREQGLEALLQRERPGPKPGAHRGFKPEAEAAFKAKLEAGEFITVVQAQRWLKEEHGVEKPYQTVWRWLKKAGGVLVRPRPSHSKKDPAAEEEFKAGLAAKLEALNIAAGSRVKLWMMDEARFGLHTDVRRVWAPARKTPGCAAPDQI